MTNSQKSKNKTEKRTALITGAATGIGLACATILAENGMQVAIADIDIERAVKSADELNAAGYSATAIHMDVANEDDVNNGVAQCLSVFGSMDVLVSNAGIQIVHPFEEYPFSDWKKMMAIHADGAFLTSKAAYTHMKANGGGKIIFMGSVSSHTVSRLKAAYSFAKHGLLGLCRVIAREGADYNIHSYTICPAFVLTALVERQIPEQARALGISEEEVIRTIVLKDTVDGKVTTLDEVARIVQFVADDASGSFTGQSFNVSHGWCMK